MLGGAQGFKRFIEICPSDYCGLNLCFGCMAESSTDPANEVPEIITTSDRAARSFSVTFATSLGGRNRFQEVWPDEGDMNMHRNMQVLQEVGAHVRA